jgi:hypothetical protein
LSNDYGAVAGVGYEFKLNEKSKISLQLIDYFGVANINKPSLALLPNLPESNHTFSFTMSYVYQRAK